MEEKKNQNSTYICTIEGTIVSEPEKPDNE